MKQISSCRFNAVGFIKFEFTILYQTSDENAVYNPHMNEVTDDYAQRKLAGEEAGDMLAEEARLDELGVGFPLNMMHTLYYECGGNAPQDIHPRIAELVAQVHPHFKTSTRIYEQNN